MSQAQQHVLASAIVLALLVVLCIHVFLFPMYTSSPATRRIRISSYEQALCHDIYSRAVKTGHGKRKTPSCPKYGIISAVQGGRLGNQIWEYASVWAIARRTGLEPYMPRCILKTLEEYFEHLSIPSLSSINQCIIDVGQIVNSLSEWNSTEQNIIIPKYAAYWSLILVWLDDFRQEFKFQKSLRRHAKTVLKEASARYNLSKPTYVGVHVRRTDYIDYLWQKLRVRPAPVDYYFKAMNYFDEKYENAIFVVASDNIGWCKYHLLSADRGKFRRIVFISSYEDPRGPGKDLAVLASCDHAIIDYGTYGAFGAVLAAGETIVYNVSTHFSTMIAEALPNWKIIT
ncbi:galactoside 2-alpha-L-fucosyltransferase 2-like [Copidosoma floridanum]|uniref:galactoside 2-alpha-L-fucosyltransferase 2-like n=1 Tax=Copidosoma floridanum TaxID=29053 RepID=UPI0006C9853E|nr:galactoside 2-alpha-L-fucosyltransferase 2-like [Copidosoma floridanum]